MGQAHKKASTTMVMWAPATYRGSKVCVQNTMTNASKGTFQASMSKAFPGLKVDANPLNSVPGNRDNFFGLTPCSQDNLSDMNNMMSMGFDRDGSSMWKKRWINPGFGCASTAPKACCTNLFS